MKMRPQFNLRFRDADQFLDVRFLADEADIPVNEWILRQIEKVPLLLGARLTAKMEAGDEQIAKPGKRGKGGQAVEQGIESARIRSEVGGKEGAGGEAVGKTKTIADGGNIGDVAAVEFVRTPELTEGRKAQGWALNKRVPARPLENPIETDAVGTTGCKVTVSRPMAGHPAPEWRCVCGSTGKRMKGKELVCFSCGRGA